MVLEWYPRNYADMPPTTPIVAFILGAAGVSCDEYCKLIAQIVSKRGWRICVMNRVGFGYNYLKSEKFVSKSEHEDFHKSIIQIKEVFSQAPIYMMGVSAGANNLCRYLGNFPENPIECAVSISNPFNIGRISFYMK